MTQPPITREQAKALPQGVLEAPTRAGSWGGIVSLTIAHQGPWDVIVDALYGQGLYIFPIPPASDDDDPRYGIGVPL